MRETVQAWVARGGEVHREEYVEPEIKRTTPLSGTLCCSGANLWGVWQTSSRVLPKNVGHQKPSGAP